MATRTRAFVDHQLSGSLLKEPLHLVKLLEPAIPACQAVERFWLAEDPSVALEVAKSWKFDEPNENGLSQLQFGGAGGIGVSFGPHVAEIYASARWRGFLTLPALREVHRSAFSAIAMTIGATRIVLTPSYAIDDLADLLVEGVSFDACIGVLKQNWGPSQAISDEINDGVIADCEHCPPRVWYLERI